MIKRITALILMLAYINLLVGCTTKERLLSDEIFSQRYPEKIVDLVLVTGEVVTFSKAGGRFDKQRKEIIGISIDGKQVAISIDYVLYAHVARVDPVKTLVYTVGYLVLTCGLLVAAIAATSCPLVYSYDGENYTLDAEPLGGATCKGLQRNDISRLEHLKAVDGEYRLIFRNKLEETQYTDQIKLLAVDHLPGTIVTPDSANNLHAFKPAQPPLEVTDEEGRDLSRFFAAKDNVAWQSHLPVVSSDPNRDVRHHLTFVFPKPENANRAKLFVNAGTAQWGSNMIREMLQLRGDKLDSWYDNVNRHGSEFFQLIHDVLSEEMYVLKVNILEGDEWMMRGYIPGGGPLIYDDRLIDLDISGVESDKLRLRLNPPLGFWSIDYIGVVYDESEKLEITELPLCSALNQDGEDVVELLSECDGTYQIMPNADNWLDVSFSEPPRCEGLERTIFLSTTGYYEIHIDKERPAQTELIRYFQTTPGEIVRYSMVKYKELSLKLSTSR